MKGGIALLFIAFYTAIPGIAQRREPPRPPQPPEWLRPAAKSDSYSRPQFSRIGYQNVITANFPQLVVINGAGAVSVGVEYERFITSEGFLSVQLPVCLNLALGHVGEIHEGDKFVRASSWYAAPGIRFHPLGNARRVDLSFGPQVAIGSLNMKKGRFTNFGVEQVLSDKQYSLVAGIVSAGINFHPVDHFVIGINIGYGLMLSETDKPDGSLFQFGLKLGGRF